MEPVVDEKIHRSVVFGRNVRLGENVVIDEYTHIGDNVFIGHNTVIRNNVFIDDNSVIGHNTVIESHTLIGKYTTIQSLCFVASRAMLGDHIFMAPSSMILNTQKISHGRKYPVILLTTIIRNWARIGAGSICMPGITMEKNSQIAAGSIATKDIPEGEIWIGVPAKYFKNTPKDEIE